MTDPSAAALPAEPPAPAGADISVPVRSFADFGVTDDLTGALAAAGITSPFPIQELTLPLALRGADIIGQARTGTGKTLAFGVPLLQRMQTSERRTQSLVIVPTRELCLQVTDDLQGIGTAKGVRIVAAYGGRSLEPQAEAIAQGAPVVVGTPGRLLDLMRRGHLDLSSVTTLVLDEADEMLDLGFLPDVEQLIQATAVQRQTMLFSATMPSEVVALARRYMRKPTFLRAEVEQSRIAPETRQYFFSCHRMDKPAVLARILQTPGRGLCVVFSRTKRMADVLAKELRDRGVNAAPIHSDLRQEARERAMSRFRSGKVDVLVATEVAARGLDIDALTHVVNYDCPDDEKMYLHRIGRTGRAGGAGVAITLAIWNELPRLDLIRRALDIDEPVHEVFSTSPLLGELFDLPARTGRRASPPVAQVGSDEVVGVPAASPAVTEAGADGRGRRRGRGRKRQGRAVEPAAGLEPGPAPEPGLAVPAAPPPAVSAAPPAAVPDAPPPREGVPRRTRVRKRVARPGTTVTAASDEPAAAPPPEPDTEMAPAQPVAPVGRDSAEVVPGVAIKRTSRRQPGARPPRERPPNRRSAPVVDSALLRGQGKPALHRPMAITHLP